MIYDWEEMIWGAGRWRGHKTAQRMCSRCEIWETPKTRNEPCRGKRWEDLTHAEKVAAMGGQHHSADYARNVHCSNCGDTRGGPVGHETSECFWRERRVGE